MFAIAIVSVVFWGGIFMFFRALVRARTAKHELEIHRLKMHNIGADTAPEMPASQPQPSGPSKSARFFGGIWKATRWTAPRLLAGVVVTGQASARATKHAVNKGRSWNQARLAEKAKVPSFTQPAGGNVLSPEQERELVSTPAYMRKGKVNHEGQTLH